MTNLATGTGALFKCDQWLAKGEGDKKIVRLLDAEADTLAPPTDAGQLLAQPSPDAPPGDPQEQLPPATGVAAVTIAGDPLRGKLGLGAWGQPGYKITFQTSNVCLAGTNAQVFFELIGENGSSGKREPASDPLPPLSSPRLQALG